MIVAGQIAAFALRHWAASLAMVLLAGLAISQQEVAGLRHQVAARDTKLAAAAQQLAGLNTALAQRDTIIRANAEGERDDAARTADFWKGQSRAAFDAGYASRRCGGGASPGGVQPPPDLRAAWSAGAFRAAPAVPGQP